ncbi:MAG: RICIN domain-containing protein [Oscillospiraceae bacterium]|jgi:1-phosphatidylinositol phosphodiesterase|nr:RICIN domain-containing protein [Oscillospiraceae bacterium]
MNNQEEKIIELENPQTAMKTKAQKKPIYKNRFFGGAVSLVLVCAIVLTALHFVPGVNLFGALIGKTKDNKDMNTESWMSLLPENCRLTDLAIPGTHDTATYQQTGDAAKCQTRTITEQLEDGIRYFDLRMGKTDGDTDRLSLWHSDDWTGLMLDVLLIDVSRFLEDHPGEVVIAQVTDAKGRSDFEEKFTEQGLGFSNNLWYTGTAVPALGQVRGKIVLLRNYKIDPKNEAKSGINLFDVKNIDKNTNVDSYKGCSVTGGNPVKFFVQDNYAISSTYATTTKMTRITDFIASVKNDYVNQGINDTFFINFWSVAFNLSNPKKWADEINPKMESNTSFTDDKTFVPGVEVMDFYTAKNVANIIKSNFKDAAKAFFDRPLKAGPLEGWYYIKYANSTYVQTNNNYSQIGVDLKLGNDKTLSSVKFYFKVIGKSGNDYVYSIRSWRTEANANAKDMFIEISNSSKSENAVAQLWTWNDSDNRKWTVKSAGPNDNYSIINKNSGQYMTPKAQENKAGTAIVQSKTSDWFWLAPVAANQ